MGIIAGIKLAEKISNIVDKATDVFFGERRKRARIKLEKLENMRDEIMKKPPTASWSKKVHKLNKAIKKIESYLQN